MTLKAEPREYNGKNYSVAIMNHLHSDKAIKEEGLTAGKDDARYGMLLAADRDELMQLENNYFRVNIINNSGSETEQFKENAARMANKYRLLDGYDEVFFAGNDLLMIFIEAGSGSERYDIEDISIESGLCNIIVRTTEPPLTCDMESWIIFVSIPKEVSADITEYKYSVLPYEWESQD